MTESQRTSYFRRWQRAFSANWFMDRGRVRKRDGRTESESLTAVVNAANRIATEAHRSPTADDLRHACHIVAIGRPKSSKEITNAEIDRIWLLFSLLTDPDNVDAVVKWQHPEIGERERLVKWISSLAPDATILVIARNAFGDAFDFGHWQSLDIPKLKWLGKTLRSRQPAPEPQPALAYDQNGDPDWTV